MVFGTFLVDGVYVSALCVEDELIECLKAGTKTTPPTFHGNRAFYGVLAKTGQVERIVEIPRGDGY